MLTLFADTDMDITPAIAGQYGYKLISMPYSIDGETVFPYVDFEEFDAHSFYQTLRSGKIPSTSAISKENTSSISSLIFPTETTFCTSIFPEPCPPHSTPWIRR